MGGKELKIVFILGAGASADAGVPMMANFLKTADRLFRDKDDDAIQDVFRAISELRGVYEKSHLDLDNIEAVFGAVEMAGLLAKLADRDEASIAALRENLISLIVRTVEQTTRLRFDGAKVHPASPYGHFSSQIRSMLQNPLARKIGIGFSILTFNYDVALEHSLFHAGLPFSYGLDDDDVVDPLAVFKLHGSINWGICSKCGEIVPYKIEEFKLPPVYADTKYVLLEMGTRIREKQHGKCRAALMPTPVLVPPTWNKDEYHSGISLVWRRAAKALGEADNIFVIGYSLPESDSFFRYLFALGSMGDRRLKSFWIVNPDGHSELRARYDSMLGSGLGLALERHPGTFHAAIDPIFEQLVQQLPER